MDHIVYEISKFGAGIAVLLVLALIFGFVELLTRIVFMLRKLEVVKYGYVGNKIYRLKVAGCTDMLLLQHLEWANGEYFEFRQFGRSVWEVGRPNESGKIGYTLDSYVTDRIFRFDPKQLSVKE